MRSAKPGWLLLAAPGSGEACLALSRRRPQAGQSLVEMVVAAALIGVGVVTGLEAIASADRVSSTATAQARATCAVRAEAQFLEATPWNDQATGYPTAAGVTITPSTSPQPGLQVLTVSAGSASTIVYKAQALSSPNGPTQIRTDWCDQINRPG